MASYDFIWIASIILGTTVLGWLVIDWLESAQNWEESEIDPHLRIHSMAKDEYPSREAFDLETELMLFYPLDPFAPAMMWRPQPQSDWDEVQAPPTGAAAPPPERSAPELRGSEAA